MRTVFANNKILTHILLLCLIIFASCSSNQKNKNNKVDEEQVSFLEIPDGKIAYKIYGQGKPLIMCMGYSGNMDMWDVKLINILKQKYKVIAFDYRGMGFSTNTDITFLIKTLANDINLLCEHLKINKAAIFGWSMGGYVAQSFTINYPDKVDKLILHATDFGGENVINPDNNVLKILSDTSAASKELISILFPENWFKNHPESKEYFAHVHEPLNHKTIVLQDKAITKWLSKNGGAAGHLYQFKMPVLIISGDVDAVVLYKNSENLFDSIPNSSLIKIKNGGHGLMYQYPNELANYIIAFVE